ncbi:MAG: citrate synthase/methylcitrate synthase [Candidatus Tectomicrobia bacterium]|uniref:Citrate synthase n=1 Tax=Tectimicrobiota bacterium TaxID=2528274 RepID=A0A933GKY7_UNCTE|nr:citrate synthase/methylcitrate synthase [Candidatus Tectomicrobia bacterium]
MTQVVQPPASPGFVKGLEGVIASKTKIGFVDGMGGRLVYRGININELAEFSNFEETAYLLFYGQLPKAGELAQFKARLQKYRQLPESVLQIIKMVARETHPMAALRTAISSLGCFDPDVESTEMEKYSEIGLKLITQVATAAAAVYRARKGQEPIRPDPSLDHTANFLYMCSGKKTDDFETKVMDVCLILHADHGMNASTFTSMVVISSLSDFYSAITAAIGSLKGTLHGGANEQVIRMLMEIGSVEKTEAYIKRAIENKKKIPGFGHRVYKTYDPRAIILSQYSERVTTQLGTKYLYDIAKKVEDLVVRVYGERGIFPNVDFFSGSIYHSFGFESPMYPVLFAVARIAGWVARVLEYLPENKIYRPKALYEGLLDNHYIPMDQR